MKKLDLVPQLEARDFNKEVEEEMVDNDVSIHYESDGVDIDWEDDESFPVTKNWLLETYGEVVKEHSFFAIEAT